MPYLLYCVTEAGATTAPRTGVRGAAVESLDSSGLRCFYFRLESIGGDAETLQRDALSFHGVNRALFEQSAIIPFRFPTTLDSLVQVDAYIRNHAQLYHAALADLEDKVQMEIRIAPAEAAAAGGAGSGTGYLKIRAQRARGLERAIAACRVAINEEVIDWRQRESAHGVRCFALITRKAVSGVQEQMKRLRLDSSVTASLSGPWPPTEFLPAFHD